MSLSLQEVEHIAKLARLKLTDEQKARYRGQLETILDHFARLQKLDTKEVKPTASISAGQMPLRADEPKAAMMPARCSPGGEPDPVGTLLC